MQARKEMVGMAAKVGAIFGALAFLSFGFCSGVYYGGFGTVMLLNLVTGETLGPALSLRIIAILGMMLGVVLFAVISGGLGALFGTVIGYVLEWQGIRVVVDKKEKAVPAVEGYVLKSSMGLGEFLKKIGGTLKKGCCCIRRLVLGGA